MKEYTMRKDVWMRYYNKLGHPPVCRVCGGTIAVGDRVISTGGQGMRRLFHKQCYFTM